MSETMCDNKKIDDTLTAIILAGIYATGKKHAGLVPQMDMLLLKDCLDELKKSSLSHRGISFLGTKMPGTTIKILDKFSHGLAYQYSERNRFIREKLIFELSMKDNSDLRVINLGAGFDFVPDLYTSKHNHNIINIDNLEVLKRRRQLNTKRPTMALHTQDIPLDLSSEKDLKHLGKLINEKPSFVIAKGLFPYLEPKNVMNILKQISSSKKPALLACSFLNTLNSSENMTDKEKKTQADMNYKSAWKPNNFHALCKNLGLIVDTIQTPSMWMIKAMQANHKLCPDRLNKTWDVENLALIYNKAHKDRIGKKNTLSLG